ncbi:MAG: hypothetical protein ACOC4M_04950 [Promethearchaeia archaeon]
MALEFYKVKEDKIHISNKFTHDDIVFISDGKAGYIWKGENANDLDELSAKKVEKLIRKKFEGTEFQLIPKAKIYESDNPKIKEIKIELNNRLPNPILSHIKSTPSSIFNKVRKKYKKIKNYEDSWKWRKKLSNITNIWKLLIVNVVVLLISILIMINKSIFYFQLNDFVLLIALISLCFIFVLNLIYVFFPMKIQVLDLYGKEEPEIKEGKMPPSPKLPKQKKSMHKTKLDIKKIDIPEIKPKTKKGKKRKKVEGMEYASEEEKDLGIPSIPSAPKKKLNVKIKDPNLSTEVVNKMEELEDKDHKVVLVNCDRCKSVIPIPVPRDAVKQSELPIVPISYVHKNMKDKDEHCITIYVDHDFDIRRRRFSDVIKQ